MSNENKQLPAAHRAVAALEVYRDSFGELAKDETRWATYAGRIAELIETVPAFSGADTASKLIICRQIAATNLWPGAGSDGEAYVVKYGSGAAYMVGPRGWITLLYRAGAAKVAAACVHDGDSFDPGSLIPPTPPRLVASGDPDRTSRPITHAVAYVKWADGTEDFFIADRAYLDRVKKVSPAGDKGPWGKWPDQMSQAKALRLLARNVSRRSEIPEDMRGQIAKAVETDADNAAEVLSVTPNAPAQISGPTEPPEAKGPRKRASKVKPGEATLGGDAGQGQTAPQQAPSVTPAPREGSADRSESGGAASPGPTPPAAESVEARTARAMAKEIAALGTDARSAFIGEHGDCPDEPELLAWFIRIGFDAAKKAARAFVDARKGGK